MGAGTFLTLDGINFAGQDKANPTAGTVRSYGVSGPRNAKAMHFVIEDLSASPNIFMAMNTRQLIVRGVLVSSTYSGGVVNLDLDRLSITTFTFLNSFIVNYFNDGALSFTLNFAEMRENSTYVKLPDGPPMFVIPRSRTDPVGTSVADKHRMMRLKKTPPN